MYYIHEKRSENQQLWWNLGGLNKKGSKEMG